MRSFPAVAVMEEFQESDVLWPPDQRRDGDGHGHQKLQRRGSRQHHPHHVDAAGAARPGSSAPVDIPAARSATEPAASWARGHYSDDGTGDGSSASFVPPHEIAARRRRAEERGAAFSVCVGHGRTLKGRDLRSVRTAVLRMTGFLES